MKKVFWVIKLPIVFSKNLILFFITYMPGYFGNGIRYYYYKKKDKHILPGKINVILLMCLLHFNKEHQKGRYYKDGKKG